MRGYNSSLQVDDIKGLLHVSADDAGDIGFDDHAGYGSLNADKAFKYIRSPYIVNHSPVTSRGAAFSHTYYYGVNFLNGINIPVGGRGYGKVDEVEVRKTVSFTVPAGQTLITDNGAGVWGNCGLNQPITGYAPGIIQYREQPGNISRTVISPVFYCQVVPGSISHISTLSDGSKHYQVTLRTYVYDCFVQTSPFNYTYDRSSTCTASNVTNWRFSYLTKNDRLRLADGTVVADYLTGIHPEILHIDEMT
ncbi:hypothetical protein BH10BAC5_BH10BAC5_26370 [soil metagenome]